MSLGRQATRYFWKARLIALQKLGSDNPEVSITHPPSISGGPERSVGRGAQPTCQRSAADPAFSPSWRHIGSMDASAAVRLPPKVAAP